MRAGEDAHSLNVGGHRDSPTGRSLGDGKVFLYFLLVSLVRGPGFDFGTGVMMIMGKIHVAEYQAD